MISTYETIVNTVSLSTLYFVIFVNRIALIIKKQTITGINLIYSSDIL
jgi:hypothetical protein